MKTLRAVFRLFLFALTTTAHYILLFLGIILAISSQSARKRWKVLIVQSWARSVSLLMGMKITVNGTPPSPPFFLVSNHVSYIDIIAYFTHCNTLFIAKSDVRGWPIMGHLASVANTLFIDRNSRKDIQRVNDLISKSINSIHGALLFPEGTSTVGEEVGQFKPGLLAYPAQAEFPVSYSSISYRSYSQDHPAHLKICWWGDMTFPDHLFELFKIPRFEAIISFGENRVTNSDRKKLAVELHDAVSSSFIPVTTDE